MRADLYQFTKEEKKSISKAINKALYYNIKDFEEDEIDFLSKLENHFKNEVQNDWH